MTHSRCPVSGLLLRTVESSMDNAFDYIIYLNQVLEA